jgi:hypothetical protein
MLTLFAVLLVLAALLSIPMWPYSRDWGYYPSGGLGFVALIVVLVAVFRN